MTAALMSRSSHIPHAWQAIEAWWWTGEAAADLEVPQWLERAERQVATLADNAGPHAGTLRQEAAGRMRAWQAHSS